MACDTTEQMRELARIYGVSERTAWSWAKKIRETAPADRRALDYLPPLPQTPRCCEYYGRKLPKTATFRRRYFRHTCRAAAHYERTIKASLDAEAAAPARLAGDRARSPRKTAPNSATSARRRVRGRSARSHGH